MFAVGFFFRVVLLLAYKLARARYIVACRLLLQFAFVFPPFAIAVPFLYAQPALRVQLTNVLYMLVRLRSR